MFRRRFKSLRSLLLAHELTFLLLVAVTGALAGAWAYFWQKTSAESVRLSQLTYSSLQIRSDLFRQIKEVTYARLADNASALTLYGDYSRRIDKHFNTLWQLSQTPAETAAVQSMQQSYRVLQNDMNNIFSDPYFVSRVVPIKILDLQYEQVMVGDFEKAQTRFEQTLRDRQQELDATVARWTRYAPFALPVPLLAALGLIVASRRWLKHGYLQPMREIIQGARLISIGDLSYQIPVGGVDELADLTRAINQTAKDLATSRDALVESEKSGALGALVPVVAHNIRNPLASIRASAQLLDHADDRAEITEIKAAVIDTVDRLGRWVSALVSYLHPLKPHPQPRSPAVVMEAAVRLLQNRLEERRVNVERRDWDVGVQAQIDADLMEQAMYGLLSNALDASPEGSTITLGMKVDHADSTVELTIEDQGPGMPFVPLPSSALTPGPTTKRFGTGLGIPVAFKVCKAHGWTLTFEGAENGGTRVRMRAPIINEHEEGRQHG
jgi:signal transduction histidine kinase